MPASAPPPSTPPQPGVSTVVRVGSAVGAGVAAALACAVPAALRVANGAEPGVGRALLALGAAALVPMVAAVVVLRGARDGLRAFAGPGAALRGFGVALWLTTMLVGLSIFGSMLRATTHHHGLAGVTYAFGALALAVGDGLVCARIVAIARAMPERGRRVLVASLLAAAGIVLFAVGVRFVRAASKDAASYAAAGTVVDVLAFALAALFASRASFAGRRLLAIVGPPVAVVLAAMGMGALRDPAVHEAVVERAPAFAPAADGLSGK